MQGMESLRWILLRADGGLRAGWRLLGHAVLLVPAILLGVGVALLAGTLAAMLEGGDDWSALSTTAVYAASVAGMALALLGAHAVSGVLLDATFAGGFARGRTRSAGVGGPVTRALGELIGGALVGAVALVPALVILAIGGLEVQLATSTPEGLLVFGLNTLMLLPAAAAEEFLFRGYGFLWVGRGLAGLALLALVRLLPDRAARLSEVLGFGMVVGGLALLFGIGHGMNPGVTWLSTANTALAGLWLGVMVVRTRTLWVAIGAHWSWNWVHGIVLGLPLSGMTEESTGLALAPLLRCVPTAEAEWLSGGAYGLEGSVAATVAMGLAIVVAGLLPRRSADDGAAALRPLKAENTTVSGEAERTIA